MDSCKAHGRGFYSSIKVLFAPCPRPLSLGDALTHWLYPILRKTHKKEGRFFELLFKKHCMVQRP